ncbi:MAG: N-methyl-L-tryptophan oxidase [Elusimicrobia bacterium]|nr:N-methyl-L-tryptophan oxidase [Elusimicrobiota bacterium]
MAEKPDVVVVGGGIMGVSAAYWLASRGKSVVLLDQSGIPNAAAASGDHLRVFRLSYGKDAFYTAMAMKSLPLWLEWGAQANESLLLQNGVLDLAVTARGYEEDSFRVLKEMKVHAVRMEKGELRRHYPMLNTRAIKYGIFHKDGGMLWASRATAAVCGLAQRKGVRVRTQTKAESLVRARGKILAVKDSEGKQWKAESFLFTAGYWTPQLLKPYKIPLKVTRQQQLYLRPPINRGRYRPEHFPVFAALSQGFYGFPLHIHGFMKIGDHGKGPTAKPEAGAQITPAFERKCRAFLKRFMPELSDFTESEGSVCYYDNTKDGDFILDRLPGAANAFVACGFSGHGFKFAPLIGKTMAEFMTSARPELNMHRFRLSRF